MDKEIFKQVSRIEERTKLFADLAQAQTEVICKGKGEALCKLRAAIWSEKSQNLECTLASTAKLENQEEFLGYFFIGGEKYYFEGRISVTQGKFYIPLPKELFQLQRRQNYRVRVPENYQAFFTIVSVNSLPHTVTGNLADLSAQGCKVVSKITALQMKVADKVTGHLVIGKNSPIEIQGIIRHIKNEDSLKNLQAIGIEFEKISPILENKLFALTMEIHKDIFRRPS
ncbi:MAG: PilZ domain-containing protein [Bdellovibrio sp.]|nr:PilZ domain-containing protein [Bdellovibrio sp.]